MKLLLTLGPGLKPDSQCHILVVDWKKKAIVDTYRFQHNVYHQTHKGFAGASHNNGRLLAATEVELLEFDLAPLRLCASHTYPFLNDVHHIVETANRIWVCNTGLDCVEEFDKSWQWVTTHHLIRPFARRPRRIAELMILDARKSWKRLRGKYEYYTHLTKRPPFRNIRKLCRQDAYRRGRSDLRVMDFRPHVLHPNHLLPIGDDLWVTLWQTGEIISLQRGRVVASHLGRPHDGIIAGNQLFVTDCKTNQVIVHEIEYRQSGIDVGCRVSRCAVTENVSEGFLRGIAVQAESVFVGLTARRGSSRKHQTARVIELERRSLQILDEWVVPLQYGRHIFSVVNVTDDYA